MGSRKSRFPPLWCLGVHDPRNEDQSVKTIFIRDTENGPRAAEAWCWVGEVGRTRGHTFSGWLEDVPSEGSSELVARPLGALGAPQATCCGYRPAARPRSNHRGKAEGAGVPRSPGEQVTQGHRGSGCAREWWGPFG